MKIHIVLVSEQVLANLIPILMEGPDLVLLVVTPGMAARRLDRRLQTLLEARGIHFQSPIPGSHKLVAVDKAGQLGCNTTQIDHSQGDPVMRTPLTAVPTYSDERYLAKVGGVAKKVGRATIEKALWLNYAASKPGVPAKAKATIYGALGYLILPADLVPDVIPFAGFSDDLAVLAGAVGIVALYIDAAVKAQASAKLCDWFGPV